jgi:alkylation response protein AidB-like acyl-CoA dehydrogenase
MCAGMIAAGGTDDQKRALLPGIASGERIFALAAIDPSPRWGPKYVKMKATAGNGDFELNGIKPFVLYASVADSFLVAARTAGAGGSAEDGISFFVVDKNAPGVRVRDLVGKPLEGLVSGLGEVTLENVRVPASAVLGQAGQGWRYLEQASIEAIPVLCSYKVGGMEALTEMGIEYSQSRVVFAQPIGRFQRVQDRIIDAVNHRDSARWINYETIWMLETGRSAEANVHMAKAVASEGYYEASDLTAAVFGGIGIEPGTGVNKHIKMARRLYSYLGDPVYHRSKMVDALAV